MKCEGSPEESGPELRLRPHTLAVTPKHEQKCNSRTSQFRHRNTAEQTHKKSFTLNSTADIRGATMSSAFETGREFERTVKIPALLTNSLRVVLESFGSNIIELKAHGSTTTPNQFENKELRKYGAIREEETNIRLDIGYSQLQTGDGKPTNPLDSDAREMLYEHMEAILGDNSLSVEPDLSVTSFTVQVEDETLQEVTPAQTSEFNLRFVADPSESSIRDQTRRINQDRGLYDELGFKIHDLNLRSVVETAVKYGEQGDGRYLSWQGPDDIRPRAPQKLATRINDRILPDEYSFLKPYKVADDSVLQIDEDSLNLQSPRDGKSTGGDS